MTRQLQVSEPRLLKSRDESLLFCEGAHLLATDCIKSWGRGRREVKGRKNLKVEVGRMREAWENEVG